jgi:hypothetical protein
MAHDLTMSSPTYGPAKFADGLAGGKGAATGVLSAVDSWAVECWIKRPSAGSEKVVIGQGFAFWFAVDTSGNAVCKYGGSSDEKDLSTTTNVADGNWHHFALSLGPGGGKFYVDGVLKTSNSTAFTGTTPDVTTNPFGVGQFGGVGGFDWDGSVDEVVVWNVDKYTSNFTPQSAAWSNLTSGIVSIWHLDDNGFDTAGQADPSTPIDPTDPGIVYSPANWGVSAGVVKSINPGAYFRTLFTGSSCVLSFDTSSLAGAFPRIVIRVDRQTYQRVAVDSTVICTMPTLTDAGTHLLEVVVEASNESGTRWASPQDAAVVLTGIRLASGSDVLVAPRVRPKTILIYGDSITEGVRTLALNGVGGVDIDRNSAVCCWSYDLLNYLDAEVGVIGFGGSGISVTSGGGVPPLSTSYNELWNGQARTFPTVDLFIWLEGQNDGGADTTTGGLTALNGLLSDCPGAKGLILEPFSGNQAANLQTIVAGCSDPSRVTYQDTTGWLNTDDSSDGLHPYGYINLAQIAPRVAAVARPILYPTGGAIPSVSDVRLGTAVGATTGTLHVPAAGNVLSGVAVDAGTGTLALPTADDVVLSTSYGNPSSPMTGTVTVPAQSDVRAGVTYGASLSETGTYSGSGSGTYPTASQVLNGVTFGPTNNLTGNVVLPAANTVKSGTTYGAASGSTGTYTVALPAVGSVASGVTYGSPQASLTGTRTQPTAGQVLSPIQFGDPGAQVTGTVTLPGAGKVLTGTSFGAGSGTAGTLTLPLASQTVLAVSYGDPGSPTVGTVTIPIVTNVKAGVTYGASLGLTGTYAGGSGGTFPTAGQVTAGVTYGPTGADFTGTVVIPASGNVLAGIDYGAGGATVGTLAIPAAGNVLLGSGTYGNPGSPVTPTLTLPPPADVTLLIHYGNPGSQLVGTVTIPSTGDVRLGTTYGPSLSLTGTLDTGGSPPPPPSSGAPGRQYTFPTANLASGGGVLAQTIRQTPVLKFGAGELLEFEVPVTLPAGITLAGFASFALYVYGPDPLWPRTGAAAGPDPDPDAENWPVTTLTGTGSGSTVTYTGTLPADAGFRRYILAAWALGGTAGPACLVYPTWLTLVPGPPG